MKQSVLKEIGLDFTVSKRPLCRIDKQVSVNELGQLATHDKLVETNWYATTNDSTDESLGVVGNQYTVTQNEQIMETLEEIAKDNGFTISHSGPLNGGRQCFAQLKLNESIQIGPDELVKYVVATWGHDGKHGVRIGYGNRVVSCSNQFYQFYNKAQYKLRHNSTIDESLRAIPIIMNEYKEFEDDMYKKFEEWTKVPIWTDRKIMDFRNGLWKDLLDIDKKLSIEEAREKYSTRKWNAAMDLQQSINTEMQVHGDTLWGLFNGVTHFVNHKKSVPNRPFGRDESLIIGGGAKLANKAYKMIDAFAETL
tara:strand:- start:2378 stop:3304 length:927 start_codon:yes stop_codon:yes gene_type:complete